MKMPIGIYEDPPSPHSNLDNRSVTDSVGSESSIPLCQQRPRMDVACVLDIHQPEHLTQRKKALEELRQACHLVNADLHHIQVGLTITLHLLKEMLLKHTFFFLSSLKNLISEKQMFLIHFTMLMLQLLIYRFKFNKVHYFTTLVSENLLV